MRKLIHSLVLTALTFFAASCQQENLEPVASGNSVTYTIQIPDVLMTKTSVPEKVDRLIYQVYRKADIDSLTKRPIYTGTADINDAGKAELVMEFVRQQEFIVLFWAQNSTAEVYDIADLRKVSIVKEKLSANDFSAEAFSGFDTVKDCVSASNGDVELTRPISQINIITSEDGLTLGQTTQIKLEQSEMIVDGLYDIYNVYNGEVASQGIFAPRYTFTKADVPTKDFKSGYKYVAMSYVGFAGNASANINVRLDIYTSEGKIHHNVNNIPVKANYRTNILGNLITGNAGYAITIDKAWDSPDAEVVAVAVSTAADLQTAINEIPAGVEGNIQLEGNIDLGMISTKSSTHSYGLLIPADKSIIIDLNGKKLTWSSSEQNNWMIENHGTLSLIGNGEVVYTYAGVADETYSKGNYTISNSGSLTVDGPVIKILAKDQTPDSKFSHALYVIQNSGKFAIESGRIENRHNIAVRQWIDNETVPSEVVVNGGEVYGVRAVWMQLPNNVSSKAPKGQLTINGGSLTAWENAPQYDSENRLAVYSTSQGNQMKNIQIRITGGVINGDIALTGGRSGAKVDVEKVTVLGGTFNGYLGDLYSYAADALAAPSITINGGHFSSLVPMLYLDNAGEVLSLAKDIVSEPVKFKGHGTLDLNGKTISGIDNETAAYCLITNNGTLKIKSSGTVGTINVSSSNNRYWNARSAVLSNETGGSLTVESNVLIQHRGGTDMAYAIDNLTNGQGTSAVTIVNGATVKSTYRAIRQFLNGVQAANELYVKDGSVIESTSDNKSIWMQDPNNNANSGKLVVESGARLKSDVYLDVSEGSTEWPIEVSIADTALVEGVEIISELPEGYILMMTDGIYEVIKGAIVSTSEELIDALKAAMPGSIIYLSDDITVAEKWDNRYNGARVSVPVTIDGLSHTLKFTGEVNDGLNYHAVFRFLDSAIVRNLTFDLSEASAPKNWLRAISSAAELIVDNCTFIGSDKYSIDNAIVVGDDNSSSQHNYSASISNSTFRNWRRGVSDNENAQEVKSLSLTGNTFVNSHVYLSAYDNVTFTENIMQISGVNITSYTSASTAKVTAIENILDDGQYNVIGSASMLFTLANVKAQDGFIVNAN